MKIPHEVGAQRSQWRLITALMIIFSVGPLVALTWVATSQSSEAVREQAHARVDTAASISALYLEQEMEGLAQVATAFAQRPILERAFEDGRLNAAERVVVGASLRQLWKTRQGIGTAFIAHPDGRLADIAPSTPSIVGKDFSYRDWYRGVKRTGLPYVSEAYVSAATGHPKVVAVASPMWSASRGGSRQMIGIVVAAYSLKTITSFTRKFAQAQGVVLRVADRQGRLLAGPTGPVLDGDEFVEHPASVPVLGWAVSAWIPADRALANVAAVRRTVLTMAGLLGIILLCGILYLIVTVRKRRDAEDEVRQMAQTDALTELGNRRHWDFILANEIDAANTSEGALWVALLDLDHFKDFNDEFGHQAGDRQLRDCATAWRSQLRESDTLARYGGEEFCVALPDCDEEEAAGVIERIRATVPRGRTVSAGMACWRRGESAEELVARADEALYRAKAMGRNRLETDRVAA